MLDIGMLGNDNKKVKTLKKTFEESKQGWLETHDVPDWFKKAGADE